MAYRGLQIKNDHIRDLSGVVTYVKPGGKRGGGGSRASHFFYDCAEMKQKMVKGVTHCFLPTCSKMTWPFMNYCGRTHAQQGKKMGLVRK